MNSDSEDNILNPDGPSGETVFHNFKLWCLTEENVAALQAKIDQELMHVRGAKDDRLLVLLGSLLVENAVDEFIAAIMPGFKRLRDNKDFTFSMRIGVAQALQLIPVRILQCADTVRQIRNDFAHELSIDSFDKLKPGKLQSLRVRLADYNSKDLIGKSHGEIFEKVVSFTVTVLYGYAIHIEKINKFLRSEEFMLYLKDYVEQHK